MTFCPGKCQLSSLTGGWKRDLMLDLEAIRNWGGRVLVSLMEAREFDTVSVPTHSISTLTKDFGIEWIHIPIVDGLVPDETFLERWKKLVGILRDSLDRGDGVVFHCLGGLGRTGTMAACLLIETGVAATLAITAVRAARPGAIENKAQEDFVLAYKPITR